MEKYPAWLAEKGGTLSAEDLDRFTRQYGYVKEICTLFDEQPDNTEAVQAKLEEVRARVYIQEGCIGGCGSESGHSCESATFPPA